MVVLGNPDVVDNLAGSNQLVAAHGLGLVSSFPIVGNTSRLLWPLLRPQVVVLLSR